MLAAIILLLVVLWLLGYGPFAFFDAGLLTLNGNIITLWDILIFAVILLAISILPSPLREIVGIVFVLWLLSTLGVLAGLISFTALSPILLVIIIVGVVAALF